MTTPRPDSCDLCGLPLRFGNYTAEYGAQRFAFCCAGCRMVYAMLMEASESPDPSQFKASDLYRRCLEAGVVPASEADLEPVDHDVLPAPQPACNAADTQTLPVQWVVSGMWCPACAWVVETALGKVDGVCHATCDFSTDRLNCRYDPKKTDPDTIAAAVGSLGYSPLPAGGDAGSALERRAFIRLVICALLSSNVMMLSWSLYSGFFTFLSSQDIRFISWPIVVLATVVMVYGGGPLLRKSWWGLRSAAPGMETLVCLGAGTAYIYSLHNFWVGSWHLYFDTATMLITLVLLGKMLESKAKSNVRKDLEGFLALQPTKVRLCSTRFPDGRFVDLSQLAPGDRFRVAANEVVPADGRVLAGTGVVDTSAVTGESRPETVGQGNGITSGTRLIKGDITVEAVRVGTDALLGQMIQIIESGLAKRTPIESRTDRWLAVFVPVMAGLAAATVVLAHAMGLTWEQAFVRSLTVLVIACPCALGIAIPLARVAGMSAAGRQGILVRDFEAFERATSVDSVVFDKTGTLTYGRWALTGVKPLGNKSAEDVLALAAGLELDVDHAVARALTAFVKAEGIEPARVRQRRVEEKGVKGFCGADALKIGAAGFALPGKNGDNPAAVQPDGLSRVYLSANGHACALFEFGDALRPGVIELVGALQKKGIDLHLVSGDGQDTTQTVARQVGIPSARGGLLPAEKADYVARLQACGARVAMVGDGINDAPALAMADFSAAVHRHAALARQAAAVTFMRSDPAQFLDFLALAQKVNAKVAQNLGCAWIYNMLSIPIAMSGWLNPLVAATAMLLSSLTVIGNTLLLVRRR